MSKEGCKAGAWVAAALHHASTDCGSRWWVSRTHKLTASEEGSAGHSGSAQTQQRDSQVALLRGGLALPGRGEGSSQPGDRQASRKDSLPHPVAGLNSHWGACPGFCHLLPRISMLILLLTPQSWDSQVTNNQSGSGVLLFCSESIFLPSMSAPGHNYLMLTFSPYPGIWLFYEIAHSHLFNLKSIRQRLHFM